MSVLPILVHPDPRLAAVCGPVAAGEDVAPLAADMLETMYAAPGRGLAAPQVGVLKRLFVMDVAWREGAPAPMVFVNPAILARSADTVRAEERCLSIPGIGVEVVRARTVTLGWSDLAGVRHERTFDGFAALCVQHEHDHLDGVLTLDRAGIAR